MTLRSSDLQSDSDLDSIRNSCDDNDNDNDKLNEWMKTRQNKIVTQCQNYWALHLFSLTLDGVDVRKEIVANRLIFWMKKEYFVSSMNWAVEDRRPFFWFQ